jgi:hypothetical protein
MFISLPFGVTADYQLDYGNLHVQQPQDIVIVFSQDLEASEAGVEQACLALTLAQMLRDPAMNGGNKRVNVTMFVRNQGVKLADPEVLADISSDPANDCVNPWGPRSIEEQFADFLGGEPGDNFYGNPDFVNCPLCWCAYVEADFAQCFVDYFAEGYPGVLNPEAISPLFLGAEKVIDFGER